MESKINSGGTCKECAHHAAHYVKTPRGFEPADCGHCSHAGMHALWKKPSHRAVCARFEPKRAR